MEDAHPDFVKHFLAIAASNEYRGVEVTVLREALKKALTQGASPTSSGDLEKWVSQAILMGVNARLAEISDSEPELASRLKVLLEKY